MKTCQKVAALFLLSIVMLPWHCRAQVVVNGKNLNDDQSLQYIQLMYYTNKATFGPVFFVDHGFIEPEYADILEPETAGRQRILINGEEVTDRVTVVWVLNKMHEAGWEYMGDVVYVPMRAMNNWHVFTMKRASTGKTTFNPG